METKKATFSLLAVILVAALALPSLTLAQTPKPKAITWVGQSGFPSTIAPYGPFREGETGFMACIKHWSDWVTWRTNGRLVIEWREPGAVFPVTESDNAVSKNVVQIAVTSGGWYSGRMPETDIESGGIFFWEEESQVYEALHKYGLFQALQKIYAKRNIYWLPYHGGTNVVLGTTFPAPTPEAIKGKKMRTWGVLGDYIAMLGGTPVSLPWGDVYMAAKLGTIDGWAAGVMALNEIKLKEVGKGLVPVPTISKSLSNFLINKRAYDALPKDIQDILQNEAPHWAYVTHTYNINQTLWILRNAQKEYDIKYYYWSQKDIDRVTQMVADKIYPKMAAKSPASAELMAIIEKQMRDYGRIK